MTLSKRLRASPTSDIMTEAADALDAQSEDYRELYAEKVGLEQIVAAQAEAIEALRDERDVLRGHLEWAVLHIDVLGGNNKILRAALAQGEA